MKDEKLFKSLETPASGGLIYSLAAIGPGLVSLLFSIVIIALKAGGAIGEGYEAENWYIYCSYLVAQIAFLGIIIFSKNYFSLGIGEIYRPAKARYFIIAVAMQLGLFSLSQANGLFIKFLQNLGLNYTGDISLPSLDGGWIVLTLFVIAVLPALFEEGVFRSLMLTSMKKLGTVWCVLVGGALFSLIHHSPAQTVYQFVCGCAFALVAVRSGSALPTALSHFLNNSFVIIMYKLGYGDVEFPVAFYVVTGALLAACLVYLIFIDKMGNCKNQKGKGAFFLFAALGILYGAALWIMELFA